jgi:hypothetical protein
MMAGSLATEPILASLEPKAAPTGCFILTQSLRMKTAWWVPFWKVELLLGSENVDWTDTRIVND